MDLQSQEKWDKVYANRSEDAPARAAQVLRRYAHWLPSQGTALDFASGRGGNALLLAARGLDTRAWDISRVALRQLDAAAKAGGLEISTRVADLTSHVLCEHSFDVIVCSYYLDRGNLNAMSKALKAGGLLFYETFNAAVPTGEGPTNPDFLLRQSELLQHFSALQILFYEECWACADGDGKKGVSRLVARRSACA